MASILKAEQLSKTFQTGQRELTVLQDISFEVEQNTGLSIVGPSGSGKTTLLGLCAGLDQPTTGSISLVDIEMNKLSEDDRAYVRNQYVGFVFQNFQLLPTLTALENVMIPLELRGEKNISEKAPQSCCPSFTLAADMIMGRPLTSSLLWVRSLVILHPYLSPSLSNVWRQTLCMVWKGEWNLYLAAFSTKAQNYGPSAGRIAMAYHMARKPMIST